jgi:hypothetical protein
VSPVEDIPFIILPATKTSVECTITYKLKQHYLLQCLLSVRWNRRVGRVVMVVEILILNSCLYSYY